MEVSRHDVEREEVAVDPLPAHGRPEQSLVLVHRRAEQSEALRVLAPEVTVMERQGSGLLLAPPWHTWLYGRACTHFTRGDRLREGGHFPGPHSKGDPGGPEV